MNNKNDLMKFSEVCIRSAEIHHKEFPKVKYRPAGIMPSEMVFFVGLCKAQKVDVVIESGRRLGYSTEVLCRAGIPVISIEQVPIKRSDARLVEYRNLRMVEGVSQKVLPSIIPKLRGYRNRKRERIALLLDGPKGCKAFELASEYIDDIVFYAIHDLWEAGRKMKNSCRDLAEKTGFLTDQSDKYHDHDRECWESNGFHSRHEMMQSGAVLGLFPGGKFDWSAAC